MSGRLLQRRQHDVNRGPHGVRVRVRLLLNISTERAAANLRRLLGLQRPAPASYDGLLVHFERCLRLLFRVHACRGRLRHKLRSGLLLGNGRRPLL